MISFINFPKTGSSLLHKGTPWCVLPRHTSLSNNLLLGVLVGVAVVGKAVDDKDDVAVVSGQNVE